MEKEEIKNYPVLKNHLLLGIKLDFLKNIEELLKDKKKDVDELIAFIQSNCNHEWEEVREKDPNTRVCFFNGESSDENGSAFITRGVDVLKAKTCSLCGLIQTKQEGLPTEVCHVCWSKMEHVSETHKIFGVTHYLYLCANPECKNGSWHN